MFPVCGFAEKFTDIQNAYEILSDEDKRRAYDMHGHAAVDPSAAADAEAGMGREGFVDAEELFEKFFSGGGLGGRGRRWVVTT